MLKFFISEWDRCIISIEKYDKNTYSPLGTAFLIDYKDYNVLVTAKHVAKLIDENSEEIFFSWNTKDGEIRRIPFSEIKEDANWIYHENKELDIAIRIFRIAPELDDTKKIPVDLFEKFENIREDDDIFILGFPLGITNKDEIKAVVRSGVVAYKNEDKSILIDSQILRGNSGGPILLKPQFPIFDLSEEGEIKNINFKEIKSPRLIGLVFKFIISFEEGDTGSRIAHYAGLGIAHSSDQIMEVLESYCFKKEIKKP